MRLGGCPFFLFGMGNRRKLLYRDAALLDAPSGETVRQWDVARADIRPAEYVALIETARGGRVRIYEDEEGLWLDEGGTPERLASGEVHLPRWEDHPHGALLRILHQEILVNIPGGRPVPNFLAYPRPWYRDAAMVCTCLAETGNLHLVEGWIAGLREPFDRNNAGQREPDNLGQALYMISLVSDASHPLVDGILRAAEEFRREDHIRGITDGAEHPVYQTKWLKYGLRSLGLDDPWRIPAVFDSYSALFWMDWRDEHVPGEPFPDRAKELYPYLGVAEAHFHGRAVELPAPDTYPLTWEAEASEADYPAMGIVCDEYVQRRIAAPHTWHAAELFLYILQALSPSPRGAPGLSAGLTTKDGPRTTTTNTTDTT